VPVSSKRSGVKILVVGSGGREHALAWGCARSGHEVLSAPGNPGMSAVARHVGSADMEEVQEAAQRESVDLVVVGPEAPLADGMVNRLQRVGVRAFGPVAAGAKIESSKSYAKQIMASAGVATARTVVAKSLDAGLQAVRAIAGPCVVKADGLAAGKGVVVAEEQRQAEEAVRACFAGRYGESGAVVLVEEFLEGEELSLLVLCDGKRILPLPVAQDHKPIGEGDTGANTGGMGAYSPVPSANDQLVEEVLDSVIEPVLWGLQRDGVVYQGVLYAGLMLTGTGPKVLEFNCRFGDPECQAVLPRLGGDLGELLMRTAEGILSDVAVETRVEAALTVVAAAQDYPEAPRKGDVIEGVAAAEKVPGAVVFQAGTALDSGRLVTAGGRVLAVTGTGSSLQAARDTAYQAMEKISWQGQQVRYDIGYRALG